MFDVLICGACIKKRIESSKTIFQVQEVQQKNEIKSPFSWSDFTFVYKADVLPLKLCDDNTNNTMWLTRNLSS